MTAESLCCRTATSSYPPAAHPLHLPHDRRQHILMFSCAQRVSPFPRQQQLGQAKQVKESFKASGIASEFEVEIMIVCNSRTCFLSSSHRDSHPLTSRCTTDKRCDGGRRALFPPSFYPDDSNLREVNGSQYLALAIIRALLSVHFCCGGQSDGTVCVRSA